MKKGETIPSVWKTSAKKSSDSEINKDIIIIIVAIKTSITETKTTETMVQNIRNSNENKDNKNNWKTSHTTKILNLK